MARVSRSDLAKQLSAAMPDILSPYIDTFSEDLEAEALKLTDERVGQSPRSSSTGNYRSRFRLTRRKDNTTLTNDAEYASVLEYGSKPHVIKGRPTLAMRPPISKPRRGGKPITALKKVRHPGTEGMHIVRDALRNVIQRRNR